LPRFFSLLAVSCVALLTGCEMVVLSPSGYIASQQAKLLVISTLLMLLIIVPVIVLTLLFAWRYRASNKDAPYAPDWDHSIQLELLIWSAPLLIIIALGALTWIGTHTLDPYRPLDEHAVPSKANPIEVQVVALDWKWLFIYPEQGIAVVNEVAAPVDTPVRFRITSSSVMNAFFIPAMAGMIYAMPSMSTTLHAVINRPGEYDGFSANYSGAGFSGMRFKFLGMSPEDFQRWIQQAKAAGGELNRSDYQQLERPSERDPVRRYATVVPDLFDAIVNRCVDPAATCHRDTMMRDMHRTSSLAPGGRDALVGSNLSAALDRRDDDLICRSQDTAAITSLLPATIRD
jgi:cytochrome o ubiquinol oxidase subunit II